MSYKRRPVEVLEIEDFLSIRKAKIEIKPMTVLIGENAVGKSVISKLVHTVRELFLKESLREAISDAFIIGSGDMDKDSLKQAWRLHFDHYFKDVFPIQYYKGENFKISYRISNLLVISITRAKKRIKVNFGRRFYDSAYDTVSKLVNKHMESARSEIGEYVVKFNPLVAFRVADEFNAEIFGASNYVRNVFVPHARTMYLYINLFDIEKRYERFDELMKSFLNITDGIAGFIRRRLPTVEKDILKDYLRYENEVIRGKLRVDKEDIYLEIGNKEFDIYHISSGQQELLALMLLLRYGLILRKFKGIFRLCVEEPETHLFPTTQRDLTYLFGYMYNLNTEFLITTHSPYILSALNNLLFAKKLYKETAKKEIKERYEKIWIDSRDISIYEVKDGYIRSIIDREGLIEAEAIDKVSDEIAREADELLELAYGEENSPKGE